MNLKINGEEICFDQAQAPISLTKVIEHLGYTKNLIVIEFNGEILSPQHWDELLVKSGDQLEIVTIVGGGS